MMRVDPLVGFCSRWRCWTGLIGLTWFLTGCDVYPRLDGFATVEVSGGLENAEATEISGLVASQAQPGLYWLHNDSGDRPRLFVTDPTGADFGSYDVAAIDVAVDWEDIAVGPGPLPGVSYLYIGDIGNNDKQRQAVTLYRLPEPNSLTNPVLEAEVEVLTLSYPDRPRDAEALLVDPLSGDVFLISKWEFNPLIYRFSAPLRVDGVNVGEIVGDLRQLVGPVSGADITIDGREILIKTTERVYWWPRETSQSVADALAQDPHWIAYLREKQGEAIAWDAWGEDFFTVSEGQYAPLYHYQRQ